MRKINNKVIWMVLFVLIFCTVCPKQALAEENVNIIGMYSGQDDLLLYLNNVEGNISDISCRIASNTLTSKVDSFKVKDSDSKTLFLIDPSLSIKEDERKKFGDLISGLIDEKTDKESFAIAVYDTGLQYQCDYITDRWEIMKAYEAIEYKKTPTDITQVIYDLAKANSETDDSSYKRIIIFSDGYDKAENITKDELYFQLNEVPYSIFTIGCSYDSNKEELKSLFALSRVTNAQSFLFDSNTDITVIQDNLQMMGDYIGVRIHPDAALQDGSVKNVELKITTDTAEYVVDKDIKMFMAAPQTSENQTVQGHGEKGTGVVSNQEKNKNEEVVQASSNSASFSLTKYLPIIIGSLAGVIIIGIALFLILHRKKGKVKNKAEEINQETVTFKNNNPDIKSKSIEDDDNSTVILGSTKDGHNTNEKPSFLLPSRPQASFSLRDMSSGRVFEKSIENEIIIGRVGNPGDGSKIVLNYDTGVSKNHCRIFLQSGNFYLEDLHSANHTFLNDNMITGVCQIRTGDVLGIGRLQLKFTVL